MPLCKIAKRPSSHYLSKFLPEADRKFLTRARLISTFDESTDQDQQEHLPVEDPTNPTMCNNVTAEYHNDHVTARVHVHQSPTIPMFHQHHKVTLTFDSGAETSMLKQSIAERIGASIMPSSQSVLQADGCSPLDIKGETLLFFNVMAEVIHWMLLFSEI